MHAEIVVIDIATIALVARHARFALAFAFGVTLQRTRTDWIATAVNAVIVRSQVVIFFAALTIRSIAICRTVQAMATVTGQIVQVLVEEAFV